MSENRRYYWLKLQENFFDDDTIDFIESQENGEKYVLFYLKLCLKALKNEGKLIRYVGEMLLPYDDTGLAKLTRTDVDVVRSALLLFSKIGLIKKLDTGEIFLTQLDEMVGTETQKAKYMRQRRLEKSNNVTRMLPDCYTDIEIEQDIDIEQEKEKEQDMPALDCSKTKNLVNTFYEKITKHNQEQIEQKKKIPISQNMIAFAQKEGRLILDYIKNEDTETVLEALDNYLTVANSDTWKTVFSLTAFLKNYNEYTPAFFDPAKYDKETDTEKIVQSFRQKMESDNRFDIGLFLMHKQDWLDAGRPHGEKYWELQENWDC